jgi:hypothetical protein
MAMTGRRWVCVAAMVLAGLLLTLAGCSTDQSPVAPESASVNLQASDAGTSFLVLAVPGVQPAAKGKGKRDDEDDDGDDDDGDDDDGDDDDGDDDDAEDDDGEWPVTVSEEIGSRGGKLTIKSDGPGKHDKLEIKFQVPRGSLASEHEISMTAQGSRTLSGLELAFAPDGLDFSKPATLQIKLQKDLIDVPRGDLEGLIIWHLDEHGVPIEKVEPLVKVAGNGTVTIKLQVHSFSIYSLPPGR